MPRRETLKQASLRLKYEAAMAEMRGPQPPAPEPEYVPEVRDILSDAPLAQVYDGMVAIEKELLQNPARTREVFPELEEMMAKILPHFPDARITEIRVRAESAKQKRRELAAGLQRQCP
jgi:hypothetical protein